MSTRDSLLYDEEKGHVYREMGDGVFYFEDLDGCSKRLPDQGYWRSVARERWRLQEVQFAAVKAVDDFEAAELEKAIRLSIKSKT